MLFLWMSLIVNVLLMNVMMNFIVMCVVKLNVIVMNVVAPFYQLLSYCCDVFEVVTTNKDNNFFPNNVNIDK